MSDAADKVIAELNALKENGDKQAVGDTAGGGDEGPMDLTQFVKKAGSTKKKSGIEQFGEGVAQAGRAAASTAGQIPFAGQYLRERMVEAGAVPREVMQHPLEAVGAGVVGGLSGVAQVGEALGGLVKGGVQQAMGIPEGKRATSYRLSQAIDNSPIGQWAKNEAPNTYGTAQTVGGFAAPLEGAQYAKMAPEVVRAGVAAISQAAERAAIKTAAYQSAAKLLQSPAIRAVQGMQARAAQAHPNVAAAMQGAAHGGALGGILEAGNEGAEGRNLKVTPQGVMGPAMLGAAAHVVGRNMGRKPQDTNMQDADAIHQQAAPPNQDVVDASIVRSVSGRMMPPEIPQTAKAGKWIGGPAKEVPQLPDYESPTMAGQQPPTVTPPPGSQRAPDETIAHERALTAQHQASRPETPEPQQETPQAPKMIEQKPLVTPSPATNKMRQAMEGQHGEPNEFKVIDNPEIIEPHENPPAQRGMQVRATDVDVRPAQEHSIQATSVRIPQREVSPPPPAATVSQGGAEPNGQKGNFAKPMMSEEPQPQVRKGGKARNPDTMTIPEGERGEPVTEATGQARVHPLAWNKFVLVDKEGRQMTQPWSTNKGMANAVSETRQHILDMENARETPPKAQAPATVGAPESAVTSSPEPAQFEPPQQSSPTGQPESQQGASLSSPDAANPPSGGAAPVGEAHPRLLAEELPTSPLDEKNPVGNYFDRLYAKHGVEAGSEQHQAFLRGEAKLEGMTRKQHVEVARTVARAMKEANVKADTPEEKSLGAAIQDTLSEVVARQKGTAYLGGPIADALTLAKTVAANILPKLKSFAKNPKEVYYKAKTYLGLARDYDHLNAYKPGFASEWLNHWGDLDEATRGVELPKNDAERDALLAMKGAPEDAIRDPKKFGDTRKDLREYAIKVNKALTGMAEMFGNEWHHLDAAGLADSGIGRLLREKYHEVTGRDIKTDQHFEEMSREKAVVQFLSDRFYKGIVTGNWHIHSLHVADALITGPAYFGARRYARAAQLLSTNKGVRDWAYGTSNKGVYGAQKQLNSTTPIGRAIDRGASGIASAVTKAAPFLKGKGKYVEGGFLEDAKNAQNRVAAILKIGDEMGVSGEKLLEALSTKGALPKGMTPDQMRQVRGRMMLAMTETTGFSPFGVKNRSALGRTGVFAKFLQPFMEVMTTQSRLAYDFATGIHTSVASGDTAGARNNLRGLIYMGGMMTLLGGSAPAVLNKTLDTLDPVDAMRVRSWMHSASLIANSLMGGRHLEHVGLVEAPLLFSTWDTLSKAVEDVGMLSHPGNWDMDNPMFTSALMRVGSFLADGMTIGNMTSVEQLAQIAKAVKAANKGVEGHSTYVRDIGTERKVGFSKLATDDVEQFFNVILPRASEKESMADYNKESLDAARQYGAWQYPSQAKQIRKDLASLWQRHIETDGKGVITGITEIEPDEVQEVLDAAKEAHDYEHSAQSQEAQPEPDGGNA